MFCTRALRLQAAWIDTPTDMSFEPSFEEQELLADTFEREGSRMSERELLASLLIAATFVAAVAGVWALAPPHAFPIVPAVVCLLILVLATLVRFDTPVGFTDATQLAFVPLLFAMPLAVVPIAVVLGLAIAAVPSLRAGGCAAIRLLQIPGTHLLAVGPVAVLAIAHVEPR